MAGVSKDVNKEKPAPPAILRDASALRSLFRMTVGRFTNSQLRLSR
jgi:hypothetical protein